jgi:hypothetical protein
MGKLGAINTARIVLSVLSATLLLSLSIGNIPMAMADTHETDFNGDGYEDLAIGAINEDVNGKSDAGLVNVIFGSASGISSTAVPDQRIFQDLAGIEGVSKVNDKLGTDVAAGDFNGDGYSDLATGAPGDDYASSNTGSVNVIYGSSGGLSATSPRVDQIWTGGSLGLNDIVLFDCTSPAVSDLPIQGFGRALAAGDFNGDSYDDLAVIADDDVCLAGQGSSAGTFWQQGSLHIIYGSPSGLSTTAMDNQHTVGHQISFYSTLEAGDFNNDGRDDLAAGDPGDFCCSGAAGAGPGYVNVFHGQAGGFAEDANGRMVPSQHWTQNSPNVEGDRFGSSLSAGDFNGDSKDDLVIGAPAEDVGATVSTALRRAFPRRRCCPTGCWTRTAQASTGHQKPATRTLFLRPALGALPRQSLPGTITATERTTLP